VLLPSRLVPLYIVRAVLLCVALSQRAEAQSPAAPQRSAHDADVVVRADRLYFEGQPRASLALLEGSAGAEPGAYGVLWRAARAAAVVGIMTPAHQNDFYARAITLADKALAIDPEGIDALYWRTVAKGRMALRKGPRTSARLAQEVFDDAHRILELDPDHGGAYNALGQLNYQVMKLSRVDRFLARLIVGNVALRRTSWENAETYLREAVRLWPDMVVFRVDLGRLYLKRGRRELARASLEEALALPNRHPPDRAFKDEARGLLKDLAARH